MNRRNLLRSAALSAFASPLLPELRLTTEQRTRWQSDGVGSRARIGVLTPDFDPVPESEIAAMAPRGISVHASRIPRRPQPRGYSDAPYVDDAVDRLAELAPPVILFGYSSSSYFMERKDEDALRTRLERKVAGTNLILPTLATVGALRALQVKRIAIMHPPWFSAETNANGERYYRGHGFEVVRCERMMPARKFTEVQPTEVFERAKALVPSDAEALVIAGNGLRAVGTIAALEADLKRPVVTANQVLLWAALRHLGGANSVTLYGRIFQIRVSTFARAGLHHQNEERLNASTSPNFT
jgi:maleate isomerase